MRQIPNIGIQMRKGFLIVFEGLDFSGKTTTINNLISELQKYKMDAVYNSFAYKNKKTLIGRILGIYKCTSLMILDLVYTNLRFIKKALNNGKLIFQDRYLYSVLAYDSVKGNFLHDIYIFVSRLIVKPDLIVYLYAPVDVLVERARKTSKKLSKKDKLIIEDRKFSINVGKEMLRLIKDTRILFIELNTSDNDAKSITSYLKNKLVFHLNLKEKA